MCSHGSEIRIDATQTIHNMDVSGLQAESDSHAVRTSSSGHRHSTWCGFQAPFQFFKRGRAGRHAPHTIRVLDPNSGKVELKAEPALLKELINGSPDCVSMSLRQSNHHETLNRRHHGILAHMPGLPASSMGHPPQVMVITGSDSHTGGAQETCHNHRKSPSSDEMSSSPQLTTQAALSSAEGDEGPDVVVANAREVTKDNLWSSHAVVAHAEQQHLEKEMEPWIDWPRLAANTRAFLSTIYRHPRLLILPLCILALCIGLGVFGLNRAADQLEQEARAMAHSVASDRCHSLDLTLKAASTPLRSFAAVIQSEFRQGLAHINNTFLKLSPSLLELTGEQAVYALSLSAGAVVTVFYDPRQVTGGAALHGTDLLLSPVYRDWVRFAVSRPNNVTMDTTYAAHVKMGSGIPLRLAVFVDGVDANETFDNMPYTQDACPGCYIPATRSKLWAVLIAWVRWEVLRDQVQLNGMLGSRDNGEVHRSSQAYHFTLTSASAPSSSNSNASMPFMAMPSNRTDPPPPPSALPTPQAANITVLASAGTLASDPVCAKAVVPQIPWELCVSPSGGWRPAWYGGLVALIVILSIAVSLLVLMMLVGRRQHLVLLQSMMPSKVIRHLQRGEPFTESFANVTILFTDIVSYTSMASDLPPPVIVSMLNELYSLYDTLCEKYGLYKVETIGDAFMAVGGCPSVEDPVSSAVRVARLAQAMVAYTRVLVTANGLSVRIRAGLHSGPVTAAVVGLKMPRYSLFGDTVNTASRMESNSSPMCIHVSGATADLLRASGEQFALIERGGIHVKGKGTMHTYWLMPESPPELPPLDWGEEWCPWDSSKNSTTEVDPSDSAEQAASRGGGGGTAGAAPNQPGSNTGLASGATTAAPGSSVALNSSGGFAAAAAAVAAAAGTPLSPAILGRTGSSGMTDSGQVMSGHSPPSSLNTAIVANCQRVVSKEYYDLGSPDSGGRPTVASDPTTGRPLNNGKGVSVSSLSGVMTPPSPPSAVGEVSPDASTNTMLTMTDLQCGKTDGGQGQGAGAIVPSRAPSSGAWGVDASRPQTEVMFTSMASSPETALGFMTALGGGDMSGLSTKPTARFRTNSLDTGYHRCSTQKNITSPHTMPSTASMRMPVSDFSGSQDSGTMSTVVPTSPQPQFMSLQHAMSTINISQHQVRMSGAEGPQRLAAATSMRHQLGPTSGVASRSGSGTGAKPDKSAAIPILRPGQKLQQIAATMVGSSAFHAHAQAPVGSPTEPSSLRGEGRARVGTSLSHRLSINNTQGTCVSLGSDVGGSNSGVPYQTAIHSTSGWPTELLDTGTSGPASSVPGLATGETGVV